MGIPIQKVKSQTEPRPNALFNFVQSFIVEHPDIIDPLTLFLPGKQESQPVKSNRQNDIALHPHFGIGVRRRQRRIEPQL